MSDFTRNGGPGTVDLPMQSILDGIGVAISLLDHDWRFAYVNAQAETLAGMTKEQLLGQVIWELFSRHDGNRV